MTDFLLAITMKYCLYLFFIFAFHSPLVLAKKSELKVAVFIEPPFVDFVEDQFVGRNIEIVKLLSKSLNFTPVFIRCPFARCLTMVKQGQADMILGLKKLAEREKDLVFLNPPLRVQHDPLRFFTLTSKKTVINSFDDLTNLAVGALRGASYFDLFDKNKVITKVELTSREQLVNMLLRGRIDTFLEREETILPLISLKEYQEKFSLANYQYDKAVNSYIAISKHSDIKAHTAALSAQLKKLVADGTSNTIKNKLVY